ncbi:MAG: VanZ family protein [Clostridia bacterium]|nr:VanZ family protein [Clostridia bacterium]
MKSKVIIISVSWLLVLLTMVIIFNFSSENAIKSTETSGGVVVQVLDVVMDKEDITPPVVQKYQFPVRKVAHFTIYMLLGFCMISAFDKSFKLKIWLNGILSLVASSLYAVSDEIHQNFSAGRGPQVTDVLIDAAGALAGILLYFAFLFVYKRLKNKIRKK